MKKTNIIPTNKTIERLNKMMDDFAAETVYPKINVTHPMDGACFIHHISTPGGQEVVKSVMVYVQGDCFRVRYYITDELPWQEEDMISRKHFNDVAEAFDFIMKRAEEVNKFFDVLT